MKHLRRIFATSNQQYLMLLVFLTFFVLATQFGGNGLSDAGNILLTVVSFVFGFYITSMLTMSRTRQQDVVETLREEGGTIEAIYLAIKGAWPKPVVDEFRKVVDSYLTTTLDYRRTDYYMSSRKFQTLFNFVMHLEIETDKQKAIWSRIVEMICASTTDRARTEAMVKERIAPFEWLTVGVLLTLVIYFIFTLNNPGDLVSVLITSFVSTSLVMLVQILRGLDSLVWKEEELFWRPLEELFIDLELPAYYPKALVTAGRVILPRTVDTRIVSYPHPYPDMKDKIIEIHHAEEPAPKMAG